MNLGLYTFVFPVLSLLFPYGSSLPAEPSPGCFKDQGDGIASSIGPGQTTRVKTKLPGTVRNTHSVTLPTNYNHGSTSDLAPLVMYFHGFGGNHNECGSRCRVDTAEQGFVIAELSGYHNSWNIGGSSSSPGPLGPICEENAPGSCWTGWSGCDCSKADNCWWTTCWDSIAQAMDVLDLIQNDICFDLNQVWAMGCSNGGMFTFDLALDARSAPRIRGIVPIVGLPHYGFSNGPLFNDIPMFGMWGIDDKVVPPISNTGNPDKTLDTDTKPGGWYYASSNKVMKDWTQGLGCTGTGQDSIPSDNDYGISSIDTFTCTQGCSERGDGVRAIGCLFDGGHVCENDQVPWDAVWNFIRSFSDNDNNTDNDDATQPCPKDPNKKAKFWTGKRKKGDPKTKRCKWLKKRSEEDIEFYCSMTDGFEGVSVTAKPAREVCTGTCNSC